MRVRRSASVIAGERGPSTVARIGGLEAVALDRRVRDRPGPRRRPPMPVVPLDCTH